MCELFTFPDAIVTKSEKIALGSMYIPFQIILGAMAIDMYKRVRMRVDGVKQD
jgi:hypothetical protein